MTEQPPPSREYDYGQPPQGGVPGQGPHPWQGHPAGGGYESAGEAYGYPPETDQPSDPWQQQPAYGAYGYGGWPPPGPPQPHAPPPPPPRRGFPIVAWLVILLVVAGVMLSHVILPEQAPPPKPGTQPVDVFIMNMQSQYLIGAFSMLPDNQTALSQADVMLNTGSFEQRIGFVILAAELGTRDDADAYLRDLVDMLEEDEYELDEAQQRLLDIVKRIYLLPEDELIESIDAAQDGVAGDEAHASAAPTTQLTVDDEDTLAQQLGWLGELAITHADPGKSALRDQLMAKARRVAFAFIGFLSVIGVIGFGGFVGLVVMAVMVLAERIPLRLRRAHPDAGIYAETFAVWILLFLALQIVGALLPIGLPELLVALVAFFLSLAALLWPVVRGIPWSEVRRDIGWTSGQGVVVEIGAGLVSYAMAIPLVAIGLLGTLALMAMAGATTPPDPDASPFAPTGIPAHPIIMDTGSAGIWPKVLLILVAAVAAPIVEETMFRGVLYRSLRNSTSRWTRFGSILVSMLIVSFVFAAIHPQGMFAIPVLMALAAAMNLAREWRDSIIAPMVVHGTSNGIVMSLLMIIAS